MDEKKQLTAEILQTGEILIGIIKADLTGGEYSLPVNCDYRKLFSLAQKHKVTPLIAQRILNSENAPENAKSAFKKELFKNSMRYEAQLKEKDQLSEVFADNKIHFCFLKGHKVAKFYNEPEKRFMLDSDIYVEKDKFELAEEIIKSRGYSLNTFGDDKDVGYIKQPFLNIEIHKELKYDYDKGYSYYKAAFNRLTGAENEYELNMTNEDFYVYILSHCAHHFESGGTGIRSVLDHYFLTKKLLPVCDPDKIKDGLEQTGLTLFNQRMTELSEHWFGDARGSEIIKTTAEFILLSGVFGSQINSYLSEITRNDNEKSKVYYFLRRLFPSLSQMKFRYKILCKLPFLLPIFWGVRLIAFTLEKSNKTDEIKVANSVTDNQRTSFKSFMNEIGL